MWLTTGVRVGAVEATNTGREEVELDVGGVREVSEGSRRGGKSLYRVAQPNRANPREALGGVAWVLFVGALLSVLLLLLVVFVVLTFWGA